MLLADPYLFARTESNIRKNVEQTFDASSFPCRIDQASSGLFQVLQWYMQVARCHTLTHYMCLANVWLAKVSGVGSKIISSAGKERHPSEFAQQGNWRNTLRLCSMIHRESLNIRQRHLIWLDASLLNGAQERWQSHYILFVSFPSRVWNAAVPQIVVHGMARPFF